MRKSLFILSVAGLCAWGANVASAADLAEVIQPQAGETAPIDWSGFYLGANIGYGPGTVSLDNNEFPGGADSFDFSGLVGGAQAGYNVGLGNGFVFGIEGDLNLTNETGSTTAPSIVNGLNETITNTVDNKLDWSGALTGHIGYGMGQVMPYLLGGVAFAHNTLTSTTLYSDRSPEVGSTGNTHVGYAIGLGLAAMATSDISVFGELRYANYGSADYTGGNGGAGEGSASLMDTSARAGLNYHFQ